MNEAIYQTNFSAVDWVIVAAYLSGSVIVGIIANRYIGNLSDFIVAGRGLKIFLAIATMTGTEIGLVTVMYNAQEGFERGFSAYVIGVCWFIGFIIVGLTGFIIYRLRGTNVMTIPEFYEQRYSKHARVLGGGILAFSGILNMGLFLQVGSHFVTGVTGLPAEGVSLKVVMTLMLALVLLYTVLGGMVSVVVTDLIQFFFVGLGMVLATIMSVRFVGWDGMVSAVSVHRGAGGLNPFDAPGGGYGWVYVLWMIYMGVAAGTLWQTATLRALSAKSPAVAKKLYGWSAITFLSRVVLPATWGVAALAFVSSVPELKHAFLDAPEKERLSSQLAMPVMFGHVFPPVLLGLLSAGMMAAFMSTHDSYLLAWSAVITQDVVAPLQNKPMTERQRILLTRILIVAIGIFLLVWGLWFEAPATVWTYMAVTGTIYLSGAFVCVAFGLYWRRASNVGAILALVMGLVAVTAVGQEDVVKATIISAVTIVACVAAMVVGSLLFPDKRPPADVKLFERNAEGGNAQ